MSKPRAEKKEKRKLRIDKILELLGYCPEDIETPLLRLGPAGRDSLEDFAVVGIALGNDNDPRLIYDYNRLAEELAREMREDGEFEYDTDEDALAAAREYIDFNVLRALPYMKEDAPVVGEFLTIEQLAEIKKGKKE